MASAFRWCLVLVPLAVTSGQPALSLQEAVDQALRSHATLAAGEGRIAAAEARRVQAGLRPNPTLVLQVENLRRGGGPPFEFANDTDDFAYLQKTFEIGGKRDRRLELAAAGIQSARLDRDLSAFQIARRVSAAYWSAAGAARVRDLLRESVANFDRIVQYHRDRVREGAAAEADLIRVQLEQDRFSIAAESANQDAERARILLFQEMGVPTQPDTVLSANLDELSAAELPDIETVIEARPEMKSARQAAQRAQANARLERANAVPDPLLLGGYKRTNGLDTAIVGVQIDLPILARNQGAIGAADAEVRIAESQARAVRNLLRSEIETAAMDYRLRRRQVTETLPPLRRRAEETQVIAEAAYREGGTDLLRLLDAARTRLEAEVLYYRTLTEYHQSVVALRAAMGLLP